MEHPNPSISEGWPQGAVKSGQSYVWGEERPDLVYDPALHPPIPSRTRRRLSDYLSPRPEIWLGALVLGAMIGGSVLLANPRTYSATGLLLGLASDDASLQDELATIRSDDVMHGIVERVGADRLLAGLSRAPVLNRLRPICPDNDLSPSACAFAAVQPRLQGQIVAERDGGDGARMLRVTAIHPDPDLAIAMVDAAVAADRKVWRLADVKDRAHAVEPQLAAAESTMDHTSAEAARIRAEARVTDIAQDLAAAAAATDDIARRGNAIRLRQSAIEGELAAARSALQGVPLMVSDSRQVSSGDTAQDTRTLLVQLKLDRAHMAQLYTRDYPGIVELDHKIEAVEAALREQAHNTVSVSRDVRNPTLSTLSATVATLETEGAGLVRQREELQRQYGLAESREAGLRDVAARLATLQQRQGVQEAVVSQLSADVANLRAQDALTADRLSQRRLMQRPPAVPTPWTGAPVALLAGAMTGLFCGMGASIFATRSRRRPYLVEREPDRQLAPPEAARIAPRRDEAAWQLASLDGQRSLAVQAQPMAEAGDAPETVAPDGPGSISNPLAEELAVATRLSMFAHRRERDILSLGFDRERAGHPIKNGDFGIVSL